MTLATDHYDPAYSAPVGAYLTDEKSLVRVLESDHSGVIAENCLTEWLVELTPRELTLRWRQVTPQKAPR